MVLNCISGVKELWLAAWALSISDVLIEHYQCTTHVPYGLMYWFEFIDTEEARCQFLKQCLGRGIQL